MKIPEPYGKTPDPNAAGKIRKDLDTELVLIFSFKRLSAGVDIAMAFSAGGPGWETVAAQLEEVVGEATAKLFNARYFLRPDNTLVDNEDIPS